MELPLTCSDASLMPIPAMCMLRFWVKHTDKWRLYEMAQRWDTIPLTLVWESGTEQTSQLRAGIPLMDMSTCYKA